MATTINLGKDYTITGGVENITDLNVTITGEKIDCTTRAGDKPLKFYETGLTKTEFECTVLCEAGDSYSVGASVAIACNDYTGNLIILSAARGEPKEGFVDYKLKMTKGNASATPIVV